MPVSAAGAVDTDVPIAAAAPPPAPTPEELAARQWLEDWHAFDARYVAPGAPASGDPEASRSAFQALLAAPIMQSLEFELRIQPSLAQWLLARLPGTRPLVDLAVDHFKWRQRENDHIAEGQDAAALGAIAGVNLVNRLLSGTHERRAAAAQLMKRVRRFGPSPMAYVEVVPDDVRALLQAARTSQPFLLTLFEPSAVRWWDRFLAKPRLPRPAFFFLGFLSFLAALVGPPWVQQPEQTAWMHWAAGIAVAAVGTALLWLWAILIDSPWHPQWRLGRITTLMSKWPSGWMPMTLVLVVIASVLPDHGLVDTLVWVAGAGLLLWARLFGGQLHITNTWGMNPLVMRLALRNLFQYAWLILGGWVALADQGVSPVLNALTVGILVFSIGEKRLTDAWERYRSKAQRCGFLAVIAVAAITLGVTVQMEPGLPDGQIGYLIAAMALYVLQWPAKQLLQPWAQQAHWYVLFIGWSVFNRMRPDDAVSTHSAEYGIELASAWIAIAAVLSLITTIDYDDGQGT